MELDSDVYVANVAKSLAFEKLAPGPYSTSVFYIDVSYTVCMYCM